MKEYIVGDALYYLNNNHFLNRSVCIRSGALLTYIKRMKTIFFHCELINIYIVNNYIGGINYEEYNIMYMNS